MGSPGESVSAAVAKVATCGNGETGRGVGAIPGASTVPADAIESEPPVTAIELPVAAHCGRLRKARTSVTLPRASGGYERRPWLTVTSRSCGTRSHAGAGVGVGVGFGRGAPLAVCGPVRTASERRIARMATVDWARRELRRP